MLLGICWAADREYSRKRVEHGGFGSIDVASGAFASMVKGCCFEYIRCCCPG